MVMTLNLDYWETLSLTAGCNLYSSKFRLCVLTVRSTDQQTQTAAAGGFGQEAAMYFRERDKPVVPAETFLATAVPKLLMGSLIIFLNIVAIISMIRTNRRRTHAHASAHAHGYALALPQSTQGLLHSLFITYLILGLLTMYSQVSLSTFLLGDMRIVEDQGKECLIVNSLIIALSLSISLHLVSLAVDRTLASYLPFQKYASLARGTVPLWLLSIWLPSIILGALPLAGWKTHFSFCVFLLQFNDDYLRFTSCFFLACLFLIPLLYLFFFVFIRQNGGGVLLYRWHRKLQAHHRLTFALVLAVNTGCWAPFHVYVLLACQTCPYASLGSGFTLEYLFILALTPALIIPLMFSLRSSFMDTCTGKIGRCVTFDAHAQEHGNAHAHKHAPHTIAKPPLPFPKSPLFFIDDLASAASASASASASSGSSRNGNGGNIKKRDAKIFVPHYLPGGSKRSTLKKTKTKDKERTRTASLSLSSSSKNNKFKSSFKSKYDSYTQNRTLPLKNFCAYLNNNNNNSRENSKNEMNEISSNNYDSLGSDYKYGFPIIPTHGYTKSGSGHRSNTK